MSSVSKRMVPGVSKVGAIARVILRQAARHWDVGLLTAMIATIVGMTAYLMWPHPEYVLTIETLPEPAIVESPAKESIPINSAPPRKSYPRRAKKAAVQPPVLNINTATESQLDLLPGIGPALAGRIVEYRTSVGPFASIEQITEVKGIGPKNFEKMKPYLKI